ncbi:alpha/beta hydrolase domain-containing protein [Pseudohalioglobus sediminis]|uniref:alpha/beta hydrolase domain-containing protein n=1 Tax=Pseudohalioglobus sediminis TaxID=2606449 RepID=UPI001CB70CC3|nr:alpha/beta hydrolase domain-containing protein [Pseudohalioglobus sediminis]
MRSIKALFSTLLVTFFVALTGCSDSSDRPPQNNNPFLPIADPAIENPPDEGEFFLQLTNFPLADLGYRSREFFLSGTATAFVNLEELGSDGRWSAEPAETADYRTRVVVVRPENDAEFSGTVFVEWLNVTSGFDIAPSWNAGRTGLLRDGHAWVGVSAQFVGIEGSDRGIVPFHLKAINPPRYESLLHPGDSFSYDMFSQVAQALRNPLDVDLLEGLSPQRLIAMGESQSASRLTTYINAVHPLYNAFDGYLVHSRGDGSSALAQDPQTPIPTPEVVTIRTDLNAPVLNFQTETDILFLGFVSDRQDDSDTFRLWEVTGTAHADTYTTLIGFDDRGDDPQFAVVVEENAVAEGLVTCPVPLNNGPHPWVFNAALDALNTWVRDGVAPPQAERLALNDTQDAFVLDDNGNVLGGIRTPYVDVPAARLSGEGQAGGSFCFLFGTTELFDAATMAMLYVDKQGYVDAVAESTDDAVAAGFLLPPDAERIKAAAALQWDALAP